MMKTKNKIKRLINTLLILNILIVFLSCNNKQKDLLSELKSISDISQITEINHDSIYKSAYELKIIQPVDHNNPDGEKFTQRVYLSHIDFSKPVVFITEGYSANRNYKSELSDLLNSNQIIVEHRYFGESKPDSLVWNYLTIKQAAEDHHHIVQIFKKLYTGKWLNTGISKGGQTTMYHRYFFPNDVDMSVPYVAPLNFSTQDARIYTFLDNVGTKSCREKIMNFQKLLLKNENKLIPMVKKLAEKKGYAFSIGVEKAFEYNVLEFSFAFWQWGLIKEEDIPENDKSIVNLFNCLTKASSFNYFSDQGIKELQAFFYQALTQIGYYGYDITPFKGLLNYVTDFNFNFAAPKNVELKFDPKPMKEIKNWLDNKGENFIYIYGENDTWSATSYRLSGKTNAKKIYINDGTHITARIKNMSDKQKEIIFSALEKGLDIKIEKANNEISFK
ncbi:MAG: peptidase [Bacteroidetes bacterium]|nr:peptidase [Bacteroidota bacterium]